MWSTPFSVAGGAVSATPATENRRAWATRGSPLTDGRHIGIGARPWHRRRLVEHQGGGGRRVWRCRGGGGAAVGALRGADRGRGGRSAGPGPAGAGRPRPAALGPGGGCGYRGDGRERGAPGWRRAGVGARHRLARSPGRGRRRAAGDRLRRPTSIRRSANGCAMWPPSPSWGGWWRTGCGRRPPGGLASRNWCCGTSPAPRPPNGRWPPAPGASMSAGGCGCPRWRGRRGSGWRSSRR